MSQSWFRILLAAEVFLLVLLLLLAAWRFAAWASSPVPGEQAGMAQWVASVGTSDLMLAAFVCAVVYALLQVVRLSSPAFWGLALVALLPHFPGIWGHNNLQWQRFAGSTPSGDGGQSMLATLALFLLCLVGLVVLHRVIALRKLGMTLTGRRANGDERDLVLLKEGLTLAGVIAAGLAAAIVLALFGSALGRLEGLFTKLPWTLVTIGGGASLLLAACTALFLRSIGRSADNSGDSAES